MDNGTDWRSWGIGGSSEQQFYIPTEMPIWPLWAGESELCFLRYQVDRPVLESGDR